MSSLWRDLRYALRSLGKSKGFTAVAILTLALGIGVNAAIFTLTNAVLFKGFPFDQNQRIYYLGSRNVNRPNFTYGPVSNPDFRDWRAQTKSFTGLAAALGGSQVLSDGVGAAEAHPFARMTSNSLQVIGQKPVLGRDFTPADEVRGAPQVAMLTYNLWQTRYGKDPSVIGRAIRLNGVATTIVGVMPRGLTFPFDLDFWVCLTPRAETDKREARQLLVFGRMADGATLQSARAELNTIASSLQKDYPATNQGFVPVVLTYNELYIGPRITLIFEAMLVAVAFVLLIACSNVANLLLARAAARSREVSIRVALGAGQWRVVRQLLVESLVLSIVGGIAGWLIAIGAIRIFAVATVPLGRPSWIDFSMDFRVFLYLACISLGTGLLFGIAPALQLSRVNVNATLKDGGRGASLGVQGKRLSGILVVTEVALAVVLLAGAGLMIRSFLNVYQASLGVNPANVLQMGLGVPQARYPQPSDQINFYDKLTARLVAMPGVDSVAIASAPPSGGSQTLPYELEGAPSDAQRRPALSAVVISPDYFRVMDVGILQGRAFTEQDGVAGPPAVIVNQQFASKFWPGEDPLGKRLRLFTGETAGPWLTVVGIAPNIVQNDISPRQIDALIYLPYRQKPQNIVFILARTRVPPGTLISAFRRETQALDQDVPINGLMTLVERLNRNSWFYRVFGIIFVIFAGIALLLASVGLYALMAHSVSRRTQEIGVRMVVGASAGNILRLVFIQGMSQLAIGLVIGLVAALPATRLLRSALVQVSPADPGILAVASLILIAAAALGCWIPARRAVRVDPVFALRHE